MPRIRLRRSATPGDVPDTSQIFSGELAVNSYDGKLFLNKIQGSNQEIVEIGAGGGNTSPDPICKTSLTVDNALNSTTTYTQRNVFNTNPAFNTGGFTVSSSGIEVPSTGTYVAMATIFVTNDRERADVGVGFGINGTRFLDALATTGYVRGRDGNEESSTNLTSAFQLTAGDELNLFFASIARSGNTNIELQTTSNVTIFKLQ